jgi:hypothetical protein
MAMDNSVQQEGTAILNGTKGDGNEEGSTEDASGDQPVGPQVGDEDC